MTPARFAFVLHPLDARRDVSRKYPIARILPTSVIEAALLRLTPRVVGRATGIVSRTGAELSGVFIACPLTPRQMLALPPEETVKRLRQCAQIAHAEGATVLGLGAFTSIVGDGGVTLAQDSPVAVTTGNSYTVASALEGVRHAARLMNVNMARATLAVVGAGGSIGATCARVLSPDVRRVHLVGRNTEKLRPLAQAIEESADVPACIMDNVERGLRDADIVIAVTSSTDAVIFPHLLKPGAIVCDVARPRDVSVRVARARPDVLVFEGGVVAVPGACDLGFDFGFPPRTAYACMSETMILALEGRRDHFTLGKSVSVAQVEEIDALARKHGFALAGLRSFERAVTPETVDAVKYAVERCGTTGG